MQRGRGAAAQRGGRGQQRGGRGSPSRGSFRGTVNHQQHHASNTAPTTTTTTTTIPTSTQNYSSPVFPPNFKYIGMQKNCILHFSDIGANMTLPHFTGKNRGQQVHPNDFDDVLARAWQCGVERIMVTGLDLKTSTQAYELCKKHKGMI